MYVYIYLLAVTINVTRQPPCFYFAQSGLSATDCLVRCTLKPLSAMLDIPPWSITRTPQANHTWEYSTRVQSLDVHLQKRSASR